MVAHDRKAASTARIWETLPLRSSLVLIGTWTGLKLYGRLDDAGFRRIALLLLFVSGVTLIVPTSILR